MLSYLAKYVKLCSAIVHNACLGHTDHVHEHTYVHNVFSSSQQ